MFRKEKPKTCAFAPVTPLLVKELVPTSVTDDFGNVHVEMVEQEINLCDDDYARKVLPNPADYTYQNLVAAGVPLQQVNTKILTPDGVDAMVNLSEQVPDESNNVQSSK